jgi:voltage-gated sodium channel
MRNQMQEAGLGLRSGVAVGRGHIAAKAGLNIDDLEPEEERPDEQLVLQAIMEHSGKDRHPEKRGLQKRIAQIKRKILLEMKYHHELMHMGYSGRKQHPFPQLRMIVIHPAFEVAMTVLIVTNCIVIGWQAELRNPEGATKVINMIIEHLFTFLFSAELLLRAVVFNWTFWFDRENHLDIFLVTLSVLNSWILGPAGVEADFLRKATVLRILRLVRIARNFKRQFKEMWQLLRGLSDSFETLVWTYVMMLCVLYFFAISATTIFSKMGAFDGDEEAKQIVKDNFDDVLLSMLTLFQIMTLDSWAAIVRPLMAVQVWAPFFFIIFITFQYF